MVATYAGKGDSFVGGSPRLWSERQLARFGIAESFDPTDSGRLLVMLPADNPEPLDTRSHVTMILNFLDQVSACDPGFLNRCHELLKKTRRDRLTSIGEVTNGRPAMGATPPSIDRGNRNGPCARPRR